MGTKVRLFDELRLLIGKEEIDVEFANRTSVDAFVSTIIRKYRNKVKN